MRKVILSCVMMFAVLGAWAQDINLLDQTTPAQFDMYSRPAEGVYAIKVMSKNIKGWLYNDGVNFKMTTSEQLSSLQKTYLWKVTHLEDETNLGCFTLTCMNNNVELTAQTTAHNIYTSETSSVVATLKGELNNTLETFEGINIYQKNYTASQMSNKGDGTKPYIHTNDGNSSYRFLSYWVGGTGSNPSSSTACVFQFYCYTGGVEYTLTDDAGNEYSAYAIDQTMDDFDLSAVVSGVAEYEVSNERKENGKYFADIHFPLPVSKADGSDDKKLVISAYRGANDVNPGSKRYYVDGTTVKANPSSTPSTDYDKWVVYTQFDNGAFTFTIKNVGTGKYINTGSIASTCNDGVTVSDDATKFTLDAENRFKLPVESPVLYLSLGSSGTSNYTIGAWTWNGNYGTHYGVSNWVYEVNLPCELTDENGAVYTTTVDVSGGANPNDKTLTGCTVGECSFDGTRLTANITFPHFSVSSNQVYVPMLIGQGSWENSDKKWTVVDGNVMVVDGDAYLGAGQWLICPSLDGETFKFRIQSVQTGKFVTTNPASDNDAEALNTPVTLTETGTAFEFIETTHESDRGFAYTNAEGKLLFLTRNSANDNEKLLGVYEQSTTHRGNAVRLTSDFTRYRVSIGEVGYSTLYSPFPVIVNDANNNGDNKLEYFAITSEPNENYVSLQNMTQNIGFDYIPANQGTILKGDEGTYTFTKTDENADQNALWVNNKLKGSVISTYEAGPAYVLSAPEGVESVGLYRAELNKNAAGETGDTHFKNNAGKAYLPATAVSSSARFLAFDFGGEETGITETENGNVKTENSEIYDLSGRRVQNARKGIFIVNGKKVIK